MHDTRMSRGSRVIRGAWFAMFATLFAAVSHVLVGGGTPAPAALGVTGIVVLPICVALAGRERSLWRTSLAVAVSQGLFHWSFGAIGAVRSGGAAPTGSGFALSPHAEHLAPLGPFVPLLDAPSTGVLMLGAHAIAAAATVVMLRFGEGAALRIREALASLGSSLIGVTPSPLFALARGGRVSSFGHCPIRPLATALASISLRGPPTWARCSA